VPYFKLRSRISFGNLLQACLIKPLIPNVTVTILITKSLVGYCLNRNLGAALTVREFQVEPLLFEGFL
jgi:hypothetical protein